MKSLNLDQCLIDQSVCVTISHQRKGFRLVQIKRGHPDSKNGIISTSRIPSCDVTRIFKELKDVGFSQKKLLRKDGKGVRQYQLSRN